MVLQANFADHAPKRVKEWSPIDRMLANKRSLSAKRSSASTMAQLVSDVPVPEPPPPRSRSSTASTQTSDGLRPEKAQILALEAEVASLRAQLKRQKEAMDASQAELALRDAASSSLEAELQESKQLLQKTRETHQSEQDAWEQERQCLEEDKARLQEQVASAKCSGKHDAEDREHLRRDLKKSQDDLVAARRKCSKLQQDLESLNCEKMSLTREKDGLLERLETEQAEMIARVDALQHKMAERSPTVR